MRIAFTALEALLFLYVLFIVVTQIIGPLARGTTLFPFLRSNEDEFVQLRTELDALDEQDALKELTADVQARKVKNNDHESDCA